MKGRIRDMLAMSAMNKHKEKERENKDHPQ